MTKPKRKTTPAKALLDDARLIRAELQRRGHKINLPVLTEERDGWPPGIYLFSAGPCEKKADEAAERAVKAAAKAVGVKWTQPRWHKSR